LLATAIARTELQLISHMFRGLSLRGLRFNTSTL